MQAPALFSAAALAGLEPARRLPVGCRRRHAGAGADPARERAAHVGRQCRPDARRGRQDRGHGPHGPDRGAEVPRGPRARGLRDPGPGRELRYPGVPAAAGRALHHGRPAQRHLAGGVGHVLPGERDPLDGLPDRRVARPASGSTRRSCCRSTRPPRLPRAAGPVTAGRLRRPRHHDDHRVPGARADRGAVGRAGNAHGPGHRQPDVRVGHPGPEDAQDGRPSCATPPPTTCAARTARPPTTRWPRQA